MAPLCHITTYAVLASHPPFPVLVAFNSLAGFGNGLTDACFCAWVGAMDKSNTIQGFLHSCYSLGALFSPVIATSLIVKAGLPWYSFYYIMVSHTIPHPARRVPDRKLSSLLGGRGHGKGIGPADILSGIVPVQVCCAVLELAGLSVAFWPCNGAAYRAGHAHEADAGSKGVGTRAALRSRVTWLCALFFFSYMAVEGMQTPPASACVFMASAIAPFPAHTPPPPLLLLVLFIVSFLIPCSTSRVCLLFRSRTQTQGRQKLTICGTRAVGLGGWIITFMLRVRGASRYASGISGSGFWAGMAVGRAGLGFVTERFGERLCLTIYLAICIGLELLFWLVPNFAVSAVAVAFLGFFLGPMFPGAVTVTAKLLPKRIHVSAIGFAMAMGGSGGTVFPFVIGAIAASKGVEVLQPIVLSLIVVVAAVWLSFPRIKKAD